jgi:GAF domain-containing protein
VDGAGVDGAALSVLSSGGTPVTIHATDARAATTEDLQLTLGEGPAVDASRSGAPVLVGDLEDPSGGIEGRWPVYAAEARRHGVRAIFAFPLRIGSIALGTLDLYRRAPGDLTGTQLSVALGTSHRLAGTLLPTDGGPGPGSGPVSDGVAALDGVDSLDGVDPPYPMVVHQAAGMVMAQLGTTIEEAMVRLRATAFAEAIGITELATAVVTRDRRFTEEER